MWPTHQDTGGGDLSWQYKGWPRRSPDVRLDSVGELGLNIFEDDFMFPLKVMSETALEHNIATVAKFCADTGTSLAPHGKTSMSPEIAHRQLDAGAWAITASTASQARIYRAFGIPRILIAHELVDPAGVRWAWEELQGDAQAEIICLVDSVAGVDCMEAALAGMDDGRPIDVLVELGMTGGRTGCRTEDEAKQVAARVNASARLRLIGVEGYEGILHYEGDDFSEVDRFLMRIRVLVEDLAAVGAFDDLDEIVVTAGGSMFPDRVVALLGSGWDLAKRVRPVIRPGGYATHDSLLYTDSGPFGARAPMDSYPALQPALWLWSYVVSQPEPGLALLGFGKRDASYDVGLPIPVAIRRDGERRAVEGLEVFELNDQHAFCRFPEGADVRVGDLVECGISHPCATFDRWRALPLIDEQRTVVGAIRTFF